MTHKTLPIIYLEGWMYLVDKEAKLEFDTSLYGTWYVTEIPIRLLQFVKGRSFASGNGKLSKVIASSNPSLGLPIIPSLEEDVVAALAKIGLNNPTAGEVGAYKAAKGEKKYTEKEIVKAYEMGKSDAWKDLDDQLDGNQYLESLTPKVKELVIEWEIVTAQNPNIEYDYNGPKLSSKGEIIITEIIWNE